MNEALEALKKVRTRDSLYAWSSSYPWASDNQKAFDIIEKALKEKEQDQKKLKAFEFIKDLFDLKVVELLPNDSDTRLLIKCGDFKASISIPPGYIDLLKEVLL